MWKRNKNSKEEEELLDILIKYIYEARRMGFDDNSIIKKFQEKDYPNKLILSAFKTADNFKQLNTLRRKKMAKKEYDDEDFDEDEDSDDEEIEEEEAEEEIPKKPVKTESKKPKETVKVNKDPVENSDNQLNQILSNHEQRLQGIESALFRVKGSI